MSNDWKKLTNVSAWVSPYEIFKPVFVEEYNSGDFIVRVFNRVPIDQKTYTSREEAEHFANQENRIIVKEYVRPLFHDGEKDIPTGQTFEYWYKTDAAIPYYVIINMTPGEKITVQPLMGDNRAVFEFDTYEHTRKALLQDIYRRVDELDMDETDQKM